MTYYYFLVNMVITIYVLISIKKRLDKQTVMILFTLSFLFGIFIGIMSIIDYFSKTEEEKKADKEMVDNFFGKDEE